MDEIGEFRLTRVCRQSARGVAAVSAVFALVVATLMAANQLRVLNVDPVGIASTAARFAALDAQPDDPVLREQFRELDLLARRAFFSSVSFTQRGSTLLLGGIGVLLLALALDHALRERQPRPGGAAGAEWAVRDRCVGRRAVAFAGVALLAAAVGVSVSHRGAPPPPVRPSAGRPALPPMTVVADAWPDVATLRRNWPHFRGPSADGVAYVDDAPVSWDGASGEGVLWKTAVPRGGFNSPIAWGNRVFLAGGDEEAREVFCFDALTGELLWRHDSAGIQGSPDELPEVGDDTGYAAATLATDGAQVFAVFANGDLLALDFDGRRVWGKNLRLPENPYGHASSLVTFEDLLLVQFDQADGADLLAYHTGTGRRMWEVARDVDASWASPMLVRREERTEVVLNAVPFVASYAPRTGRELWRLDCMSGEMAPSPSYGAGRVFVANEYARLVAIGIDEPGIQWERDEDLPDVSSPVASDRRLFVATSGGMVSCLDVETGAVAWQKEFDEGFYASPILAAGRVYAMDLNGVMHIFGDAVEYRAVGDPALGESSVSSPAFQEGRIYIRGREYLYGIGTGSDGAGPP